MIKFLDQNGPLHAADVAMPGLHQIFRTALAFLLALAAPVGADPLVPSPPLAPDVAALPRLADDTDLSEVINDSLDEIDQRHLNLVTCDSGTPNDPYRSVEVLSDGPDLLSFHITLGGYCEGAAHPFTLNQVVTFDLATGLRTDLSDLLPPAWSASDSAAAHLLDLYRAHQQTPLTEDCQKILASLMAEGDLRFDLGPDTRSQRLLLQPIGLSHVALSCDYEAWVPLAQLRAAGFHPRLVETLSGSP